MARQIRNVLANRSHEANPGQYWRHALLEFALVIVGILVALQVNNWNEERIERKRVSDLARALIVDLERDISDQEEVLPQMQRLLRNVETFTAYTRGRTLSEIDNLDLEFLLHGMTYQPFEWHRAAFETLKSTGALQNIRNTELVAALTRYDSFTRHLDHDYENDIERIRAVRSLAQHLVDSNYPRDGEAQAVWDRAEVGRRNSRPGRCTSSTRTRLCNCWRPTLTRSRS